MTDTDDREVPATATLTLDEELDDAASDAVCDLDGRIIFVNDPYCALMQRSEAELLGRRWHDFVHLPDQPLFLQVCDAVLGSGPSSVATGRIVRPDGSLVWTSVRAGLLRGTLGERRLHLSARPCAGPAELAPANDDLPDLDALHCAAYVRQIVSELSRLTRARNLDVLSEVLAIAASVAANDAVAMAGMSPGGMTLPTRQ